MIVQSKPGTRCPKEGKPRQYIDDQNPAEVPDSTYYRRLVADGSLIITKSRPAGVKENAGYSGSPSDKIQETVKEKGGKK